MPSVLVTGGTSGLGLAITEQFLARGHRVYCVGRTARRPARARPALTMVRHDLRDLAAIGRLVTLIKRRKIECVVSNAGVYSDRGVTLSDAGARDLLTTNLVAPVLLLKHVYALFRARGAGTIVCINSLAGLEPNYDEAVYCASKHGLRGFARALQIDGARHDVRILDYYLGAMRTRMTRRRSNWRDLMAPTEIAARIVSDVMSTDAYVATSQELRRQPRSVR
jgi:NAD(P)-dependent dehydrogenase (short-subunit alcohol dehydrogenase family)